MAKIAAIVLFALLAIAYTADAQVCRISAYPHPVGTVVSLKKNLWASCGGVTMISSGEKNGCGWVLQKVPSKAAWEKYSACEKAGKAEYGTLTGKKGGPDCKSVQSGPDAATCDKKM